MLQELCIFSMLLVGLGLALWGLAGKSACQSAQLGGGCTCKQGQGDSTAPGAQGTTFRTRTAFFSQRAQGQAVLPAFSWSLACACPSGVGA